MDTHHLAIVANRIEHDPNLAARADEVLSRWQNEPLIDGLLETPQSARYHAEGPTLRSHLRLMLQSLDAIVDGKVRLLEIEEFARLRGFDGEIEEMEETIKENPATFEVLALVHDLGKQFRVAVDEQDEIHYHGHERDIWRPDVQELLGRLGDAYRLSKRDRKMVTHLIAEHMEALRRFSHGHDPKHIDLLTKYATEQGIDADDFIDFLQALVLLDQVFGSRQMIHGKRTISCQHLVNFFIAEGEYAPWKRAKREREMIEQKRQAAQKIFEEVGLDGHGLMRLTGMRPSKELGVLTKAAQAAARAEAGLPEGAQVWKDELVRRIQIAKGKLSVSKNN